MQITVDEFIVSLERSAKDSGYTVNEMWYNEEYDFHPGRELTRKDAARIIHDFLINIMKEADEIEVSSAYALRDLFECRVCAPHIAQVYEKGIMGRHVGDNGKGSPEKDSKVEDSAGKYFSEEKGIYFGLNEPVQVSEASKIIDAIFDRSVRISHSEKEENKIKHVLISEFNRVPERYLNAFFIDVRSVSEYKNHPFKINKTGVNNIPMDQLIRNPYSVANDLYARIVLWSDDGERSNTVAVCLKEAGYKDITVIVT